MSRRVEGPQVLVIEDDATDARLLGTFLSKASAPGFGAAHVKTIADAIALLEDGYFDLALLDLGLPDAKDLEGLDRLRAAAPYLPVVVVTGRDDEDLALQALQHGAEDYLTKGEFDRRLLVRTIRYAIERSRGRSEIERVSRELQVANSRLENLLMIDPLTGLLNRRGLDQALAQSLERMKREPIEVLAFFVDLDRFKEINDQHGHSVGDVVLTEIAAKLREAARGCDWVGRVGGDEFLLLMPSAEGAELAAIAERLRLTISSVCLDGGGRSIRVTACVAGMVLAHDADSLDIILSRVHLLLRRTKNRGRNCVAWEGMEMDPAEGVESICDDIRLGRGVYSVIQPIFRLADMSVAGFELLSRFRKATVSPEAVFRLCAERNMLSLADHFCLRTCVAMAEALPLNTTRHVNLFPSTVMGIAPEHLLALFPRNKELYCVELSEQQMLGDLTRLQERVEILRGAGLRIACDDVGFGRSHLESLVLLEPDVIKIDKKCVKGIEDNALTRRQLGRFIAVAHKLGAEIVAEGVETEGDLEVLRELGVDQAQGFLWGVPAMELPMAV
ncbi:MAG TPA: EAL domain-containing protein [Thermoanaerobaculia bacterium]|nr:EAL domain-containing protein [Thermoanaerobaculia bacterium]